MADAPFAFLPLGAIIQSFKVKDTNIVLGFPTQEQYVQYNTPYFGETIGRVANRIKGAQLDSVNGKVYRLAANDGPNTLHGGNVGWGKRIWKGPVPIGIKHIPGVEGFQGGESVGFTLVSEDGDEGFPGTVEAKVTYTTGTQVVNGKQVLVLGIEYEAGLVDGADETPINMTNHSYFNLTGNTNTDGTVVTLGSRFHLPNDEFSVPTGGPTPHASIDTTKPFTLGAADPQMDNCFTKTTDPASVPIDTRSQPLARDLAAYHPQTGIHLEVLSTEPSFQFYTGDFTDVPAVEGASAKGGRSAFCCEPGRWVNAVNVPEWKSMTMLTKGATYGSRIVYRAWSD
ncbi:Aldose 1-epimerase, subgroup [Metarhizium album ARSEF 1941]|uniref:Aldose 1-epimerase, subgroup n=1 Tax=Metarhizium album (strain ARSEF 1941) TaxID=1081103 RepID=A0A0B2WM95_METAS|nr:Aldose 1-epimerase, subgroup [Metarhizium album ARSEF 1941]KHN97176.1 Aldose 1-epimerase, subgroup [Metarhizium album ARSEF 1941]